MSGRSLSALILVSICVVHAGCTTVPNKPPRAAQSSYGCMVAVRDHLPQNIPDKRAHCLASGEIARRCSQTEAYIAGAGKEITDIFDGGDPEWADWRADRVGVACARRSADEAALAECCAQAGYR